MLWKQHRPENKEIDLKSCQIGLFNSGLWLFAAIIIFEQRTTQHYSQGRESYESFLFNFQSKQPSMCNTTEINIHSFACDCICVIFEVWWLHSTNLFLCQVMANSLELLINPNENRELLFDKTYTLCNPSVVIGIHQLEGLLVLWLLAGKLFPWELPVLVFVVGLEQLVHLLSGENNKSIFESLNNQSINHCCVETTPTLWLSSQPWLTHRTTLPLWSTHLHLCRPFNN